ncbi:hypothetical protein K1719_041133 [Acacia pycnantha]|nr:hypothetical protein K1719_041133 [Acacia pycnantha]
MDAVVSVTTTILEKLVDEAILQACYPFRFNKYVKELETEKENLQSQIQDVQDRAKDAKKKTQKKTKRNKTSCLKLCPNLINRYNLAKQLEEKINEIKTHNQVQFSEFSRLATLVGLHGMGGSGKTTLVKEVGKEAETFFDKVLFVVVSNPFDVRKIQSKIANQLSFELKEEENLERAQRLFMRLSGGERFLIILDDVWEKLDLMDIGIPTANNQMGCTTLLTTRKLHVCERMSCQEIIPLEGLNEDESWALFQKHAGLFDDLSNNLKVMAQNISKVCDGLPIAIVAVANTLKNKHDDEWAEVLQILRNPSWADIEEGLRSTYGCLRLSYDNLENTVVKSLFLLCSVYPEDYEIPIDQLTIMGLGLSLAGEIPSYWVGTQVINKSIKKLIDSCLLQKVSYPGSGGDIKMHDLVHDVAKWIANKENKLIMGSLKEDIMEDHARGKRVWDEALEDCKSFVARGLYIEDFQSCISIGTNKDMMRRAKTLSLRRIPERLKNIIPDLWQSIGGGEAFENFYSGQPPQGLFANLEELRINSCDSLEHILTEDVKEIVDASDYQSYKNAFPKLKTLLVRQCKKLEYLMPISFAKSVTQLEDLEVHGNNELRSIFGLSSEDLNPNKLQTIEFTALKHVGLHRLQNIISICPKNYHPTWPSLNSFSLRNCPLYSKSIIHWVACGGLRQEDNHVTSEDLIKVVVAIMESLEFLEIWNHEVEVVFDVEHLSINGQHRNLKLVNLELIELPQLTHIWRGAKNCFLLQHLESLKVVSCGNLKQVFPSSILKSLPQLKTLDIEDCEELEEIIEEEDDQNVSNSSRQLLFPKLVTIVIKRCHKLKCVFPNISACRVIPNLRALYIEDTPALEQVFGHEQHDTNLEYVLLWNLPSLTSVAPSIALQTVKYIVVQQCPKLSLTSSITPQELLKQLPKGYFIGYLIFENGLENIIESMDDPSKENGGSMDDSSEETGGQSNDQKLTIIATPNLTENKNESEDQRAHEREMSKEKSVEGRVEECTTSKNVQIVTSLAHSEPASSTKASLTILNLALILSLSYL